MNKKTFTFLAAFLLFAVVALALNGSVISTTLDTLHVITGQKGALQCINSTDVDNSIATTWKVRLKSTSPVDWNSPSLPIYKMGDVADFLYTGGTYALYEVMFYPPPPPPNTPPHTFAPTNPYLTQVKFHKMTIVTIHYQ